MNPIQKFFRFLAGRLGREYESDHTIFMREYMAAHPEEAASQRAGRAAWWDKMGDERSPHPSMRHAPKAGGNEHTFVPQEAGGAEHMFDPDDNTNEAAKT